MGKRSKNILYFLFDTNFLKMILFLIFIIIEIHILNFLN